MQMAIHVAGELVMMAAGAWGLYLRFAGSGSPLSTHSWFGPLGLLSIGLLLCILPLAPAWQAAWIRRWFRGQSSISSLLWSCGAVGCLYSLWRQYQLEFNLRTVLLLLPALLYWFVVTSPGRRMQDRNIAAAADEAAGADSREVQRA
jgi:hypothetical protein